MALCRMRPTLGITADGGRETGGTLMKKLMIALVLALAVIGGMVAASAITGTPAVADPCPNC